MVEILNDRRRALRVKLRSHTSLTTADGACAAHLLDVSESGALVAIIEPHHLAAGEAVTLAIELPDGKQARMDGHIAHVKAHLLGLDCTPATEADAAQLDTVIAQLTPT